MSTNKSEDYLQDWMLKNPKLADKYYPEAFKGMIDEITGNPIGLALVIQKYCDHFPTMRKNAKEYLGVKKQRFIETQINGIDVILNQLGTIDEIVLDSINGVREELIEQQEYWKGELKDETRIRFQDFFIEHYKSHANELYLKYKDATNRQVAFLINLLTQKKIITIERKGISRLRFTELIQNKKIQNNEAVNKYFKSFKNNELKILDKEIDTDYLIIEKEIDQIFRLNKA